MQNEATKINDNQLTLFSEGDSVEDLVYEFLKDRSPLTEQAYQRDLIGSNFKMQEGIRFLIYLGKGQKINQIPVHPTAAFYVDEYVKAMEATGRKIEDGDYLFQPTKNSHGGKKKRS